MSNLENLTQKIIDDAKEKANEMKTNADKKANALVANRVKEANDRKDKALEKAAQEAAMMKERVISSAELKIRDEKLVIKHMLLDKVFQTAKDELLNLDDKSYYSFVENLLKEINCSNKSVLKVPKGKKEILENLKTTIEVVEDESIESGFMIFDQDIVYNYNFESFVDETRGEIESLIVEKLFEE